MTECLLCNSTDTAQIGEVKSIDLVRHYMHTYKADFSYLFKEPKIKLIKCKSCDLRFYTPLVSGDDSFYSVLQKTDNYYRENKEEYKLAAQIITKGSNVLDVGCGKGEFKKFVAHSNFIGLEFSSEAIKTGIKNGCNILNQSIEEHSIFNSDKYDYVTAFQVLEHVPDIASFIKSCAKCVKPGGKLIIAVPSEESYLQFTSNSILNMPPHHISRWTDNALINMANVINFNFVQLFHDSMDNLHTKSYFTCLIEKSLPLSNNTANNLIDNSIIYKVRNKIASLLANRMLANCSHSAWQGKGQNVTAVFQKPSLDSII